MKSILIIANTYYQLMLSIQLKCTLFQKDCVSIILSDHSRGAEEVANKLRKQHIFDIVHFVNSKEVVYKKKTVRDKINILLENTFLREGRYGFYLNKTNGLYFDELIFYNYGADIYEVFSRLIENNSELKVSMIEEGLLSYHFAGANKNMRINDSFRTIFHKKTMKSSLDKFYCYYPSLYEGSLFPVSVPQITPNSEAAKIIRDIFDVDGKKMSYNQKYIFFTSVYDFEGGTRIGEYELVSSVASLVGNENLLVKTHPRDERTIYIDNGFSVDKNSMIPWEAIQLSGDFSNKVFLTINSGSVLSGSTMSSNPVKTYYLFKLCNIEGNKSCLANARDIQEMLNTKKSNEMFGKVKIAEKLEDILL